MTREEISTLLYRITYKPKHHFLLREIDGKQILDPHSPRGLVYEANYLTKLGHRYEPRR
jgi:hypothetical protein